MKAKKKKLSDIPLEIRAEEALKKAVADTIADHKRTGDPIVIWRDGRVVKIPADQIEVREAQTEYSMSTKGKSSQRPSVYKSLSRHDR
ncbi:MAG: hypothetical protein U9N58_00325 [Thermodesulfobacteriota bacterium]|nr:hypothetical protein [Thermodesulfobacteriota bacterium]